MPNHIKNRLKINGSIQQIKEVYMKYNTHHPATVNMSYDGHAICRDSSTDKFTVGWINLKTGIFKTRDENSERIGLPENWIIDIQQSINQFPDFDKIIPTPVCDAYNDIPNQQAVSDDPNWWYTWNIDNWETKWNCYSCVELEYGTYMFQTAWNGVPKLMLELSKQNPNIEFEYTYADEDSGRNVAHFILKNGEFTYEHIPIGGSKEAYDIYFELNPNSKKYYEFINNTYEYVGD